MGSPFNLYPSKYPVTLKHMRMLPNTSKSRRAFLKIGMTKAVCVGLAQ